MQAARWRGLTWPQIRYWLICVGLVVVGIAATTWGGPWEVARSLAKELGPGIFTAGILASLVEPFFRNEFARDAFLAAFRYVLPEELKEEVQRIINYKFLCTDSLMIVKIDPILGTDLVRIHISTERTMKNVTRHAEPFAVMFALDEWGFPDHHSEVNECSFDIGNGFEKCDEDLDYERSKTGLGKKKTNIQVKSDQSIKVVASGSEVHRANSELRMFHTNTSLKPVVEIHAPADFECGCTFGVPGEKIQPSKIATIYRLDGSQFPGQCTHIRWWRKNPELAA